MGVVAAVVGLLWGAGVSSPTQPLNAAVAAEPAAERPVPGDDRPLEEKIAEFIEQATSKIDSGYAPSSGSEKYGQQFGIGECICAAIEQLFARPFLDWPVRYYQWHGSLLLASSLSGSNINQLPRSRQISPPSGNMRAKHLITGTIRA